MAPQTVLTPLAFSAGQIDFAYHALADPFLVVGRYHFAYELMTRNTLEIVVAALELEVGVADSAIQQPNQRESFRTPRTRIVAQRHRATVQTNCEHIVDTLIMLAELVCFEQKCRTRF